MSAQINPIDQIDPVEPVHDVDTSTRTVFFVSDGTGITAETFGKAVMAQFAADTQHVRLPFVSTAEKARQAVRQINAVAQADGVRPIVFTTLVTPEAVDIVHKQAQAMVLDLIATFVDPLEKELGIKSNHRVGRFSNKTESSAYRDRIEAINFTLAHDDGQTNQELEKSDIILIGVSRSGKTPTALYLAMQHGLRVSNYPLIPEDFERQQLPPALQAHTGKLFGLTIHPDRLSEIRNERRPGSKYASIENCRQEIADAEAMMRRSGVQWLSTTSKSIEEIAATILQELHINV